jgi:hypothetical protein
VLKSWQFHPSSVVTTTNSPNDYKMIITMNLITNNYGGGDTLCGGSCSGTTQSFISTQIVPSFNSDPSYSSTSNTALRSIDPFIRNKGVAQSSSTGVMRQGTNTYMTIPWYSNITYVYSGSPLTIIPSLTATTCNWGGSDGFFKLQYSAPASCESAIWTPRLFPAAPGDPALVDNPVGLWATNYTEYVAIRTDANDPRSFDIYVGNKGGSSPGSFWDSLPVLIYRQVGANPPIIYDSNYFV